MESSKHSSSDLSRFGRGIESLNKSGSLLPPLKVLVKFLRGPLINSISLQYSSEEFENEQNQRTVFLGKKNNNNLKDAYTLVFIAMLFTVMKIWK